MLAMGLRLPFRKGDRLTGGFCSSQHIETVGQSPLRRRGGRSIAEVGVGRHPMRPTDHSHQAISLSKPAADADAYIPTFSCIQSPAPHHYSGQTAPAQTPSSPICCHETSPQPAEPHP